MDTIAEASASVALLAPDSVKTKCSNRSAVLSSVIAMRTVLVVSPTAKLSDPETAVASALFDITAVLL